MKKALKQVKPMRMMIIGLILALTLGIGMKTETQAAPAVKGTFFCYVKAGKKSAIIKWNTYNKAAGYKVYFEPCDGTRINTVKETIYNKKAKSYKLTGLEAKKNL